MEIGPPIATAANPVADRLRPSAIRPSSALCFGTRDLGIVTQKKRPLTARGTAASTPCDRKPQQPTTQWRFLETDATSHGGATVTHSARSGYSRCQRPATSRERTADSRVAVPTRPATARAPPSGRRLPPPPSHTETSCGIDRDRVRVEAVDAIDARTIREAAQREQNQSVNGGDPLCGKSVEPRSVEMVTLQSCESVQNAVSLVAFARVQAFHARAKGDYAGAAKHYAKAVAVAPSDPITLFQLALAYERSGSIHLALATYAKLLARDDATCFAYFNAGNVLMRLGRVEDAIRHYSAAIERCGVSDENEPQRCEFFRQRGAAYRKRGDFEKAARDYAHCHSQTITTRASIRQDEHVQWKSEAPRLANTIVYTAEPLYAAPEASGQLEVAFDVWTREHVFRVLNLSPSLRSMSDLHLLADALGACFPFCSVLSPDARVALAAKVVGAAAIRVGTPLCLEKQSGSHVFFVYRGRVCVRKTVVQSAAASVSEEHIDDDATVLDGGMHSFESVYATMRPPQYRDDTSERELEAAIGRLAPVSRQWEQRQMTLCHFGPGSVVGFQGRHSGDARYVRATL